MARYLCTKYDEKSWREVHPEKKNGWGCAARFLKPLPYYRPNSGIFPTLFETLIKNLTPYFRPEALEAGA